MTVATKQWPAGHTGQPEKFVLRCVLCDNVYTASESSCLHDKYYDYLSAEYNYDRIDTCIFKKDTPWFEAYLDLLPFSDSKSVKTLGEGNTALVASKKYPGCYYKDETKNPTGCFKDRESAVLLPYLIENKRKKITVASSGNAALSASLYGKILGLEVKCFIPYGTSIAKKRMIKTFGGEIVEMGKYYEDCHRGLIDSTEYKDYVNITAGVHPLKEQGNKVIAYEIWKELGVPDYLVVPVANGCLLSGIYKGFWELKKMGLTKKIPCFIGVQIQNGDPVNRALRLKKKDFVKIKQIPDSKAEGLIAMESFASPKALKALRETNGFVCTVQERSLKKAMRYAIQEEGLLPEWTSSPVFAAISDLYAKSQFPNKSVVVAINSGSGLKEIVDIADAIA